MGFRVKFKENIITNPDRDDVNTGGRTDLLFYIHDEDVMKFAIPRLSMGIKWLEDMLDNNPGIYDGKLNLEAVN